MKRLGLLFQHQGNLAAAHVDQAIAIFTDLGDDHCVGYANQNLGELAPGQPARLRRTRSCCW